MNAHAQELLPRGKIHEKSNKDEGIEVKNSEVIYHIIDIIPEVYEANAGITHIDFHPGQERDGVAEYIAKKGRDGLFLTTKIKKAPPGTSPNDAAEMCKIQIKNDLKVLGLNSVDMLMLRDSPDCEVIKAQWAVLEDALASGKTRSIGVINFCESALTCVLQNAKVVPALNYIM